MDCCWWLVLDNLFQFVFLNFIQKIAKIIFYVRKEKEIQKIFFLTPSMFFIIDNSSRKWPIICDTIISIDLIHPHILLQRKQNNNKTMINTSWKHHNIEPKILYVDFHIHFFLHESVIYCHSTISSLTYMHAHILWYNTLKKIWTKDNK
jgi:hypothetical protein